MDLKTEIQVLEKILKEKREELKVAEAIEKQKDELWKRHLIQAISDKTNE